jgi:hypothetical protein
VKQIEAHAQSFTSNHADLVSGVTTKKDRPEKNATLSEVFHHPLREFYYKPTFAAANLLDPAHFVLNKTCAYYVPFDKLSVSEQNDAMSGIERLGGADAVTELADAQLNGFQGLNELHRRILQRCVSITGKDHDGSFKSLTASVHKRRQLWEQVIVTM